MPTLKYLDEAFDCTTAIKGDDYIHLLDDNGVMVAAFDAITDFSGFTLENGSYVSPTADHSCRVAVIRDDGTIGVGSHTCEDIGNAVPKTRKVNGKPLSADITITGEDIDGIYSKDAVLKDQTKTLYGLDVSALPDDVFNKLKDLVGSAANTVKDTAQNKAVTISSAFHSFSTKDIQSPLAGASVAYTGTTYYNAYMRGNILYTFCRTYNSSAKNYTLYLVAYNIETKSVVSSTKLYESLSNSDSSNSYFCSVNTYSHDGSVVGCHIAGTSSPHLVDLQYNLTYAYGTYLRCVFSTPNYWGYVYVDSYRARYLYYAPRGSTSFTMVNLGTASNSSNYDIHVCGTYGDTVVYVDRNGYADFKTGRVNLATGAVSSGIDTCNLTSKFAGSSYFSWGNVDVMLTDDTHAYLNIYFTLDSVNYTTNKTIKVDLATGMTNFADITGKIAYPLSDTSSVNYWYYIGSVGTKAYYLENSYGGTVTIFDKAADSYSEYAVENYSSGWPTRYSTKEARFDIKGMPGTLPCGQYFFDANKGSFEVFAVGGGRKLVSGVGVQDVSSTLVYPAAQSDGLTEFKCLGLMKNDMTQLAVPPMRRTVQFVEEVK